MGPKIDHRSISLNILRTHHYALGRASKLNIRHNEKSLETQCSPYGEGPRNATLVEQRRASKLLFRPFAKFHRTSSGLITTLRKGRQNANECSPYGEGRENSMFAVRRQARKLNVRQTKKGMKTQCSPYGDGHENSMCTLVREHTTTLVGLLMIFLLSRRRMFIVKKDKS